MTWRNEAASSDAASRPRWSSRRRRRHSYPRLGHATSSSSGTVDLLMYARVTTIEFSPEQPDEAAMIFDSVRPTLEELQGFKGLVMLSGVDSRSLVALTLWETAADLEAASPVLETVKEAETLYREVEAKDSVRYQVAGSHLNL